MSDPPVSRNVVPAALAQMLPEPVDAAGNLLPSLAIPDGPWTLAAELPAKVLRL